MPRFLWVLCFFAATALSLEAQATSRLAANARVRVWSETYSLRAVEARLVDRWTDTLLLEINRVAALEPVQEMLMLPTAQIESLEVWASSAQEWRAIRNRLLLFGGMGAAIIAGAAGGLFSIGEALFSAAFVTLFVAAGSTDAPEGVWVPVNLRAHGAHGPTDATATARVPAAPDR